MLKYLNQIDDLLTKEECEFLINFCEKMELKEIDRGSTNGNSSASTKYYSCEGN